MHRLSQWAFAVVLSLAPFAARAADKPSATPKQLVCKGQKSHPKEAATFREEVERGEWYVLAAKLLGTPKNCYMGFDKSEGQLFPRVQYSFAKGMYARETLPPEGNTHELYVEGGFADPKEAEAFLKKLYPDVNWAKSEEKKEVDGTTKKTFWSSDDGLNFGVDLSYKDGKLVGIGMHLMM